MNSTVLLTGATGFLGYRTLEKLVGSDRIERIIATGRTIKPTHRIIDRKVTYSLGDLAAHGIASSLVKGVDSIVHAAALSSPWGHYEEFERANVSTLQNLIRSAKENDVKRIVYVSTPSIYFDYCDRFDIKESDPLPKRFVNFYAATKWQAENELCRSGIPYIIIRPRALIGRGDTVIMPRIIKAFEEGKLKIIGNGRNLVDLTSVGNVADVIETALFADDPALNQAYNISNGEPVLLWECIDKILTLLGHRFFRKKVPYPLVSLVARMMEWKSKATDFKEPVLTTYGVGTLAKSFTMDISKAKNLLDYVPGISTGQAIEEFVAWHKNSHERG